MSLTLNTITFNHDPLSATTSAMNIRRNKDFEVPIPEYDKTIPRTPAQSCAAYAIAETSGQGVFLRVSFGSPSPSLQSYEVKASGGGIAGRLDNFQVVFGGGSVLQIIDIPLDHRTFLTVGRHDIVWHWKYRPLGTSAWHNLAVTAHRFYLVLAVPSLPWTQTFADKRNPWTDLLDECCVIAAGASDEVAVAKNITRKIHAGYNLRYDIVFGADRYGFRNSGDSFNLTAWIDYVLRGNAPPNPKFCPGSGEEYKNFWIINCYDAAASLTLMAMVVGAPLSYYFHQPFGYLNYVIPIGRSKCNNPFYGCLGNNPEVGPDDPRTSFGNHAYTKLQSNKNYDACMREWIPPLLKLLLIIIWLIILITTLGRVNLQGLLDQADGWLIDLFQPDYEKRTIDTSQPFEAASSGGSPVLQNMQFQIV